MLIYLIKHSFVLYQNIFILAIWLYYFVASIKFSIKRNTIQFKGFKS